MEVYISDQAKIALRSIVRNAEIDDPVMAILIEEDWRLGFGIYEKSNELKGDGVFPVGPFMFLLDESQATVLDGKTIDYVRGRSVATYSNET